MVTIDVKDKALMTFSIAHNGKDENYEIIGSLKTSFPETEEEIRRMIGMGFEFYNTRILRNGKELKDFGETFIGYRLNVEDAATQMICGII